MWQTFGEISHLLAPSDWSFDSIHPDATHALKATHSVRPTVYQAPNGSSFSPEGIHCSMKMTAQVAPMPALQCK
jgi:hypothetical protein